MPRGLPSLRAGSWAMTLARTALFSVAVPAVLLLFGAPNAPGAEPVGPRLGKPTRPLVELDSLLHVIEKSDAIVLGRILDANEELVRREPPESGESSHFFLRYARVAVEEVLLAPRGRPVRGTINVNIASELLGSFASMAAQEVKILLLLREVAQDRDAVTHRHGRLTFRFKNLFLSEAPGEGALAVDAGSIPVWRGKIARAITLSKPVALAGLGDVVVRGRHEGSPSICPGNGALQICARIVVSRQLYGEPVAGPLRVYSAVPGYVTDEESLFFLKGTPEGSFEMVGLSRGAQVIHGDRVGRPGADLDLATVERDLAAAEKARQR